MRSIVVVAEHTAPANVILYAVDVTGWLPERIDSLMAAKTAQGFRVSYLEGSE